MKTFLAYLAIAVVALGSSCADQSGFNGGSSTQKKPEPQPEIYSGNAQQLPATPTPSPTPSPVLPDQVVDGQEVYSNCGQCLVRAQQLSQSVGFPADMSRTANMGFYKIDPSRNLCDIHFLARPATTIAAHNGQDTVLRDQIILYCPCNCGWAKNMSAGRLPGMFLHSFDGHKHN